MIKKDDVDKQRTADEWIGYCDLLQEKAKSSKTFRHQGHLKRKLFKHHFDELVPLAYFLKSYYSKKAKMLPVIGNQIYDAKVYRFGINLEKIEITIPHNGAAEAADMRKVVSRGYGEMNLIDPWDEIKENGKYIICTARNKSKKNYKNCVLVFVLSYLRPFNGLGHEERCQHEIGQIQRTLKGIKFLAREVVLFDMPSNAIYIIQKRRFYEIPYAWILRTNVNR